MVSGTKARNTKRAFKVVKKSNKTQTAKQYRFESFSKRIEKLSIDPVRRAAAQREPQHAATGDAASYFRAALDDWKDKNLTDHFSRFVADVDPISESLPQILYHESKIAEKLFSYIANATHLSLEPLLDLLSQYARDLGQRFESYFEQCITLLLHTASKGEALEVTEWSLNSLVWVFRYLSRLLVQDLRPVFDLVSPWLGKAGHASKDAFVARFVAEAFSFLLRKAAGTNQKEGYALRTIVLHMLHKLGDQEESELYQYGIMTVFYEGIRGVQRELHPLGLRVLREVLDACCVVEHGPSTHRKHKISHGLVIALLHHCDSVTARPLVDAVLQSSDPSGPDRDAHDSSRLLFELVAVREGSRILDWDPLFHRLDVLIKLSPAPQWVLQAAAVMYQYAPLDRALSHIHLLDQMMSHLYRSDLPPFLLYIYGLGHERASTAQKLLRWFVAGTSHFRDPHFLLFLEDMQNRTTFALPTECEQGLVAETLSDLAELHREVQLDGHIVSNLPQLSAKLSLLRLCKISKDQEARLLEARLGLLQVGNAVGEQASLSFRSFQRGALLKSHVLALPRDSHTRYLELLPLLSSWATDSAGAQPFWEAANLFLNVAVDDGVQLQEMDCSPVAEAACSCLALPSHDLRLAALEVLMSLARAQHDSVPDILLVAHDIESSAFEMQTQRLISARIQKLGALYSEHSTHPWISLAIPSYCFGLLHVRLASVWEDSCQAIKKICETKPGHIAVMNLAIKWLQESGSSTVEAPETLGTRDHRSRDLSSFECSNVLSIDNQYSDLAARFRGAAATLQTSYEIMTTVITVDPSQGRAQALRVLQCIPEVAERRSRVLVPLLLHYVNGCNSGSMDHSDKNYPLYTGRKEYADKGSKQRWSRNDAKALVALFASFHNPQVLYLSNEVYSSTLNLLMNGDVDLQRSSLKALLAWKEPALERYKEQLSNLLDDKQFRDQLSVFLDVGDDDSMIEAAHRESLMPVVLRVLYGRLVSKSNASAKGGGLEARRKAALVALARHDKAYLQQFVDIALGDLRDLRIIKADRTVDAAAISAIQMSPRLQYGLLNMLKDLLATLGSTIRPLAETMVEPIMACLLHAEVTRRAKDGRFDDLVRSTRQLSLRCLTSMFEFFPDLQWGKYMPALFSHVLDESLIDLPQETAHSVSATLKLILCWSKSVTTANFISGYNDSVLPQVAQILLVPTVKDDVQKVVLELVSNLAEIAGSDLETSGTLKRHGSLLLKAIERLLGLVESKDLLDRATMAVSSLAPYIPHDDCIGLMEVCIVMLEQPTRKVPPKVKQQVLQALVPLMSRLEAESKEQTSASMFEDLGAAFGHAFSDRARSGDGLAKAQARFVAQQLYETVSSQFGFFQDRSSRMLLSQLFTYLAAPISCLHEVAQICVSINEYSEERLDEPDWEKRQTAFESIRERTQNWQAAHWTPIVHNLLFYVQDEEDNLRANAGSCLRRFVETAAISFEASDENTSSYVTLLKMSLSSIQRAIQSNQEEVVKAEHLLVLAHMIKKLKDWNQVADMRILLVGDDEEASFFTNILHIQQHRRVRAMKRLAKECEAGNISSSNVARVFVPLLESFVFSQGASDSAHNLAAEAVPVIGIIAQSLDWSQFKVLLRKYAGYVESKQELEKTVMKLLDSLAEALRRSSMEQLPAQIDKTVSKVDGASRSKLSKSLPEEQTLFVELSKQTLPTLSDYLRDKDEIRVSRRVPVALTIVKLLTTIPEQMATQLPSTLMRVCSILKSKTQESRDLARKTLADIAELIGPSYFGFILKDLQRALQRGYQLHVLSFTVHSLLVSTKDTFQIGDLDYCVTSLVPVILDDIFGTTGQEKDAEGYISQMKEIKSSKSYDSMELLATRTTLSCVISLLQPIQRLLLERLNDKILRKVDELLRRLRLGLLRNSAAGTKDMLVLCYQLWTSSYQPPKNKAEAAEQDYKIKRYLVKMKSDGKSLTDPFTTAQSGKLVRFAIDIMRDIIPKYSELQTPALLGGFLTLVGDAIVGSNEDIRTGCFRLVASIIRNVKVPFPQLDEDALVYAREAMRTVRDTHSTRTELSQAAIKCAAEIIAKRKNTNLREADVAFMLKALKNDLEEPSQQGVAFGLLKATIACKMIMPEVYEMMDAVAAIMVTHQSRETRQLARSTYFSFLMDYPQAKKRLDKQIAFLVKNLQFEHVEGRESVMEALHLVLTKTGDEVVDDLHDVIFLPLVLTLVNDESEKCRSFSQILLKDIFIRVDTERMKAMLKLMLGWIGRDDNALLRQAGLQSWSVCLETNPYALRNANKVADRIGAILSQDDFVAGGTENDLGYYLLNALCVWLQSLPQAEDLPANIRDIFPIVVERQFEGTLWSRLAAMRFVGQLLIRLVKSCPPDALHKVPLRSASGIELDCQHMLKIARASLAVLSLSEVNEDLIGQAKINIAIMGRLFAANELKWHSNGKGGSSTTETGEAHEFQSQSEDDDDIVPTERPALQYIMYRLARSVRQEVSSTKAAALIPKTTAIQLLEALSTKLESTPLHTACRIAILPALHHLTDPSISHPTSADPAFTASYTQLQESARELLDKLKGAMGVELYLTEMGKVKKAALARRQDRRVKRRLELVNAPARAEAKKRRKREGGMARKKEKNAERRERRRGW